MDALKLMTFKKNIIILLLAIGCIACDKNHTTEKHTIPNNGQLPPNLQINEEAANRIADALWKKSQKELSNTLTKATALQQAIEKLLEKPTQKSLQVAQKEWRLTATAYQQLSPLLYLENKKPEGQSDIKDTLSSIHHWRNRIAAWPIHPGYIDSFGPHIHSGIVNDINLSIDAHTLRGQHLLTDDQEVTLGLYTIEYLLFGDRDHKGNKNTHHKRFLNITKLPTPLAKAGLLINELPNNRRRALIALQIRLLLNDIQTLISLYQTSGALSLAFQELTTLEKLQAFRNSTSHSLQHINTLFTFYQKELTTNSTDELKDKKSEKNNVFTKRFYNNIKFALNSNLTTIKLLYPVSDSKQKDDQKNTNSIKISDALFIGNKKNNISALIKSLEEEIEKKEASIEDTTAAVRKLSKALSI